MCEGSFSEEPAQGALPSSQLQLPQLRAPGQRLTTLRAGMADKAQNSVWNTSEGPALGGAGENTPTLCHLGGWAAGEGRPGNQGGFLGSREAVTVHKISQIRDLSACKMPRTLSGASGPCVPSLWPCCATEEATSLSDQGRGQPPHLLGSDPPCSLPTPAVQGSPVVSGYAMRLLTLHPYTP